MPVRFQDYGIKQFNDQLRASSAPKLTDSNVIELLSRIGDHGRRSGAQTLAELTKPGVTRQQQFDLAKQGLFDHEKADINALLDDTSLQMDAGARNFLEALVGRAELQTDGVGALQISVSALNGLISGMAKPGEVIEAINLTTAPEGRLHLTDTMEVGRADGSGRITGNMSDVRAGDVIRLRTRAADGTTSDWLTITATGGSDTRNAAVNLERMDLAAQTDGSVTVTANTTRPITEPGATIRFTNARTGERFDVKANENGSVPEGLKLKGQAGDTFKVAVSDGTNNTGFYDVAGELKVPGSTDGGINGRDLEDPAPLKDDMTADGKPKFGTTRFTGPLFIDGPSPADVRQGAIGDCYFPAALAAIAHSDPQAIEDMIKDNGDGTYTVRFYESSYYGSSGRAVEIEVDADLYARSFGGPVYGGSLGGSTAPDKMELWFPLIEKAYAQWKGDYEAIGNGGFSGRVMSEVLGAPNGGGSISSYNADRVWEQIKAGGEAGHPMTAGTYGKSEADRYTNTGVYANHAYSVLGAVEENGTKYVLLRNPWGQSEGGNDGKNDSFFRLPLEEFVNLYQSWSIVQK